MTEVFCANRVDRLLSRPFVPVIKAWCRWTGTTATFFARVLVVVVVVCSIIPAVLSPSRFLVAVGFGFAAGWGLTLMLWCIPAWEKIVGQIADSEPLPRRVMAHTWGMFTTRVIWLVNLAVYLSFVVSGSLPSLWGCATGLFMMCIAYCCSTLSFPGKTIKDRLVARFPARQAVLGGEGA